MKMTDFWDVASCSLVEVDRSYRGELFIALMMEALRASETSVYFNGTTRRYIPESCDLQQVVYVYYHL
jgi:hypothetical protein